MFHPAGTSLNSAFFENISKLWSFLPAATKLGQGNVFTGVCDSVNRGGLPQCMPPRSSHPPPPPVHAPWSRHPPCMPPRSRHLPGSRHPPEQRPSGADTPPAADTPPGADPPGSRHPPEADTPPGKQTPAYGQRPAGTHPTGMHSCLDNFF